MPEARATLAANHYVPFLWPTLFEDGDIRTYDVGDEGDEDGWISFVMVTDVAKARARMTKLEDAAAANPWALALWESLNPVAALLEDMPDDAQVVLDPHEVDAMGEEGELLLAMATTTKAFARLRQAWSDELAQALMPEECRESPEKGAAFAQIFTGHDDDREALFALCFGWPTDDETTAKRLTPWLRGEPLEDEDPDSRDPVGQARSFIALLLQAEAVELSDAEAVAKLIALPLLSGGKGRAAAIYEILMESDHVEDVFISEEQLHHIIKRW